MKHRPDKLAAKRPVFLGHSCDRLGGRVTFYHPHCCNKCHPYEPDHTDWCKPNDGESA